MGQARIKDLLVTARELLRQNGSDSPRLDAELLMAYLFGRDRLFIYTQPEQPLSEQQLKLWEALVQRRCGGEPLAYILGEKEFFSANFIVTPHVLIPRPETELLVEEVLAFLSRCPRPQTRPLQILDIGTGSGCIAITLKRLCPEAEVMAWELCPKALEVAQTNAKRQGLELHFFQRNALEPASWQQQGPFDVIVSNPPYIAPSEEASLPKSVKVFEPPQALFAANSGLAFYQVFGRWARPCLSPQGRIFLEIGHEQAAAVSDLLWQEGWSVAPVLKDYSGKDRILSAGTRDD